VYSDNSYIEREHYNYCYSGENVKLV